MPAWIFYALRLLAPACTVTLEWAYAAFWIAADAVVATAVRWLWLGGGAWVRGLALALNAATVFGNVLLALSLWLQGAGFNIQFFFHATTETLLWGFETLAPVFYAFCAYWLLVTLWPFALRRGDVPAKRRVMACIVAGIALNAPLLSLVWNIGSFAAAQRSTVLVPKTAHAPIRPEPLPSPRSLVLVFAEGMEATYGNAEVFGEDATPRLTAASRQGVRFTNMRAVSHTGWTIGAMVAAHCALPMGPAGQGNTLVGGAGWEARVIGATCLGDILKAHGYRTVYLGGAALAFGNKEGFLAEHGFDERYGRRRLLAMVRDDSQTSTWGVRDDFLFAFALDKLAQLAERQGGGQHPPFALALLTLDTHGPRGYPSASCGPRTGEGLLFAVRCADRLLAEFVGEVRRRHPDVVVALFSDHLANFNDLGRTAPPDDDRRLRFTAWGEGIAPSTVERRGTHFDVAPTLLDLLGFRIWTEFGFGASLLRFDSPWFAHADARNLRVVHRLPGVRARVGEVVGFRAAGPVIEIDGVRILATHRGLRLRDAVFAIAFDAGGPLRHRSFAGADRDALLAEVERWAAGGVVAGVSTHHGFNQRLPCRVDDEGRVFLWGRLGPTSASGDLLCGPLGEGAEVTVPIGVRELPLGQ